MADVFIGVGSNIDPENNIRAAVHLLAAKVDIIDISTFYRTSPIGAPGADPFINGVTWIQTNASIYDLKNSILRKIESQLGRARTSDKFISRTIDLDILVYDKVVMSNGEPHLPDPEIESRPFLAIPLFELAPNLVLPGSGLEISKIAERFVINDMIPAKEFTAALRKDYVRWTSKRSNP